MAMTTHPPPYGSDTLLKRNEHIRYAPLHRKPAPSPSIIARVGYYSCGVLFVGSLAILGSFAYITFLWWSRAGLWSGIVLKNWVTPSVTLASLVIRTSIAFQAIVCTAMVAALALRWHQVDVAGSAAVSMFRFTNSGPFSFLPWLFGTDSMRRLPGAGVLILLLALITLASNAVSTVLVSDLNLAVVSGNYSKTPAFGVNVTRKRFVDLDFEQSSPAFYRRRAEQYPSFAERTLTATTQSSGLYDTGVVLRAFLPFSSANDRSRIEYFNGTAASLMMRTICAKPKHDNITFARDFTGDLGDEGIRITGTISVDPVVEKEKQLNTTAVGDVDCFLSTGLELYVCQIHGVGLNSIEYTSANDVGSNEIGWWLDFDMVYLDTNDPMKSLQTLPGEIQGQTYLVWNGTSLSMNKTLSNNQPQPGNDSEWAYVELPLGTFNSKRYVFPEPYLIANYISGYLTLCVTMTLDQYMNISASRPQIVDEPSIGWIKSVNDSSPDKIDTESIRKQLSVNTVNLSLQERGLLSLDS